MKLGPKNNPFNGLNKETKYDVSQIIQRAVALDNERIVLESDDLVERSMVVLMYDRLLWHVITTHDLITDEFGFEVQFIEGVMTNPHYVEVSHTGKMTLVEVEIGNGEEEDE